MLPSKTRFNKVNRRIVNMKTGMYFLFDNDVERKPKSVLSNREAEILGLVSRGYVSKEIVDRSPPFEVSQLKFLSGRHSGNKPVHLTLFQQITASC